MKRFYFALAAVAVLSVCPVHGQNPELFRKITAELSSAKYQGRGYARDGVIKAGNYIARQFEKVGVDEVGLQPFTLDINTFPGKMKMSVDGVKLRPGEDFSVREYCPGVHCKAPLYYIDTLNYNPERIFADLSAPENAGCMVVCDFWFTYRHHADFKKMESSSCANTGMIYTWDSPLKFYKAYGERVAEKPTVWVGPDFPKGARSVDLDIDNLFLKEYRTANVIARIEGARHDSCYVFTAHYDHLGNLGRGLYYPGANDNASGTAGIITLAEYYAQNRPGFDMYFVAFSGEDANLRGSTWFVNHPSMPLGSIKYLFNLDMIGDNNPVQYCEVSGPGAEGFAQMLEINAAGGLFKDLNRGELAANSDHWPFAQKGVPCILFENEGGDAFQYYHTSGDDMSTMRMETYEPLFRLITEFIRKY
ncbi:MAG: M28 family peptidase [Bacteroidales bacterium]|nr:M28 family peptidase [Bacteroidales bacterium]